MLTATVHRHIRVYTYIYMHISTDIFCMYVCRMMYVSWCTYQCSIVYVCVMYIVRIWTYTRILTYFLYAKLIYIHYTCIRSIYIQYIESYTCIYVKIHTIYVHCFWEPVPNHHFLPCSACTYMDVYAVYSRIKDSDTYFEIIYVRSRFMHVYARICMYLHVYCCFHLRPLDQLPVSSYMYVYVRIWWYLYVYEVYARIVLVYACISLNHT